MPVSTSIEGSYAFRFSGFNNNRPRIYYIVGLGTLEIDADNKITAGRQTFSKTLIADTGEPNKTLADGYDLDGWCEPIAADGLSTATINFSTAGQLKFVGKYTVQRVDNDRFWLISKSISGVSPVKFYDEVTSIEVTRRS